MTQRRVSMWFKCPFFTFRPFKVNCQISYTHAFYRLSQTSSSHPLINFPSSIKKQLQWFPIPLLRALHHWLWQFYKVALEHSYQVINLQFWTRYGKFNLLETAGSVLFQSTVFLTTHCIWYNNLIQTKQANWLCLKLCGPDTVLCCITTSWFRLIRCV